MLYMKIFIWIVLTDILLSIPIEEFSDHHISSNENNNSTLNICSIDIDKIINETNPHYRILTNRTTIEFLSSWEQQIIHHETKLNNIKITFTIPYNISEQSILNKTIFIFDIPHKQLLASVIHICSNQSSFYLNYSTFHPLPHEICLHLLFNLTLPMILKEIIFCRIIEKISYENETSIKHSVGPSGIFILSQCIIIFIMMLIIYIVQTARQKNLINRMTERIIHSRIFINIFGNKTSIDQSNVAGRMNTITHPATTLQAGLKQMILNRHLAFVPPLIEEQVLAANDLTSTINDRRITRPSINRDLIPIKELTKRISVANEHLNNME